MSAVPQLRAREQEAVSPAGPEVRNAPSLAPPENPLQLLRDAIDRLKSSNGDLPDQAQVADLLAEAREALERANVIGCAVSQCEAFLREAQFEQAFEVLDAGLLAYPTDATLAARRREVEQQQKAFHTAAAVRSAVEEAKWLFEQDRIDLAVNFLKGRNAELPDQPALISGLEELEAILPQWEQKRNVQDALGRAANLEQLHQGQAALTILEEALQAYPADQELTAAAGSLRQRLADQEHRKKLARRLEIIEQKIAAQSWREAFTLLKEARKELPGAPELDPLQATVDAGLKRSECEAVAAEVRQCLADGDLVQAEQILRKGSESLGAQPALNALRDQLESDRRYREALRRAQILFGRRQLPDAERVLAQLISADRPEAQALLDAVRKARAATEEEDFRERGRQKALDLMQQEQFAPAIDLLRNLLTLFPGNLILERDLAAARSRLAQATPEVVPDLPEAEEEDHAPPPAPPEAPLLAPQPMVSAPAFGSAVGENPSPRFSRAAIAGAASLLLVSASGAVWRLSRRGAPPPKPPSVQTAQLTPAQAAQAAPLPDSASPAAVTPPAATPASPAAQPTANTASGKSPRAAEPAPPSLRPFVPVEINRPLGPTSNPALPPPPVTGAILSAAPNGAPAVIAPVINAPARPAPPAAAQASPATPLPTGGRFDPPQIIERQMPDYPPLARSMRIVGLVHLDAILDQHGNLKEVKVLSGHPVLAAAAKNAVLKWKFKAGSLDGQPVASDIAIQITFNGGNN